MPRRLYLVRHGETEANRLKIIEGKGNGIFNIYKYSSPLNSNGLLQAQLLGCALADVKIHHLYISHARRTFETANQICFWNKIDHMPLKKSVMGDLVEINFGVIEGLNGQKAREKYPDLFRNYYEKPSQTVFPKGESILDAYKRISRALKKIIARHNFNEHVLIVSHGGVMALIFVYLFKLDLDNMFHAIIHNNCGLSIIEWVKQDSPKIICMNDISHLKNEYAQRLREPTMPFLSS